jgi:pimeloyl-ACP methyl ester carboxylesterase
MAQLNLQTTTLEYVESGSGQPVVLVHGSASDHRTWEQQMEAFPTKFRVVSYSRRYHWPNEPVADGAEYSMSDQVDDLELLVKSLDITGAHIVGHSYGAYLALMVAIRNPTLLGSLVLAEPPVIPLFTSFPPKPHEILKLLVTRPKTALPIIKFAATGLGPAATAARKNDMDTAMTYFGKAVLGGSAFESLSQTRLEQVHINSSKAELISESFMTPLDENDVRYIEAQTLLVTGEKSPAIFHRLTDRLEELIPNTERVDIPNASHIMHEDNAAAYNHAILSFLQE